MFDLYIIDDDVVVVNGVFVFTFITITVLYGVQNNQT